jgi:hypothetical protein
MTRNSSSYKILILALALQWSTALVVPRQQQQQHQPITRSQSQLAVLPSDNQDAVRSSTQPWVEKVGKFATTAAVVLATSPWMALAEEVDDYEYGAVNAPIGIAWAGGVLAILTALLPVALRGGEEAFEEMRERDEGKFGTGDSSGLDRRKKR